MVDIIINNNKIGSTLNEKNPNSLALLDCSDYQSIFLVN